MSVLLTLRREDRGADILVCQIVIVTGVRWSHCEERNVMASPLTFGGEETFSVPPERLFAALTDLDQLTKIIPDLVSSERIDERTLKCVVRPGFSFLRGTLKLQISIIDRQPP